MYLFPKLPVGAERDHTTELMNRFHLLSVPGHVAGPSGRGHIRLFFGLDDLVLTHAAECLAAYVANLERLP